MTRFLGRGKNNVQIQWKKVKGAKKNLGDRLREVGILNYGKSKVQELDYRNYSD